MANIHPTAIVADGAQIADDAIIGPYCVVSSEAVIGSGGDSIARNKFRRTTGHQAIIWLACER